MTIDMMHFNGDLNTGLALCNISIMDNIAEGHAGVTILYYFVLEEESKTH